MKYMLGVMTEQTRSISYSLYGLFIMDLSLRSIKTNNWSADNFWFHVTSMSCTLEHVIQAMTLVNGCHFGQLSIDQNMDVHKDTVHYQVKHILNIPLAPTSS